MTRQHWRAVLAAAVAGVGLLIASAPALAAVNPAHSTGAHAATVPGTSLAIAPTRILIRPGDRPSLHYWRVQNDGTTTARIAVSIAQTRQNRSGGWVVETPRPGSGAPWIRPVPRSFILSPGQIKRVAVRVSVPRSARGSGQRYLAVVFRLPTVKGRGKLSAAKISPSLAGEIILAVPGRVVHKVGMTLHAPGFTGNQDVPLSLIIRNEGTAYALLNKLTTSGDGKGVTFPGALVIGGATRQMSEEWHAPAFCFPCHVALGNASASVWGFPLLPAVGALLIILGVLWFAWFVRRRGSHHPAGSRRVATVGGPDDLPQHTRTTRPRGGPDFSDTPPHDTPLYDPRKDWQ